MARLLSANIDDIDEDRVKPYLEEFKNVQYQKNVKNIALMGPYGSGKSSILMKLKENSSQKYICINMIEFSDEIKKDKISEDQKDKQIEIDQQFKREDKIEKVEQSIVQQLIYQEPQKNIPFSKLKKEYPTTNNVIVNILVFLLGIVATALFFSFNCHKYLVEFSSEKILSWTSLIGLIYIAFSFIYISFKLIYYFYKNFKISRISYSKNNANIICDRYESVYNKYLDEIIYFFKETSYDAVIFEDIDRYNDLLFFSHLRELNSLLNNSKYLNRKITFIYAIKDDLFLKQDKHKFFDYIIPVVPIIDYTNSLYKFKEFIKDQEVSEKTLKMLSFYVSDLRTLKNICNEFDFYKSMSNVRIFNKDCLLSILVFKNLYPQEFSKLQYNESVIDEIFKEKDNIIKSIKNPKIQEVEHLTRALKDKEYVLDPKFTLLGIIQQFAKDHQNEFRNIGQFKIKGLIGEISHIDNIIHCEVDWEKFKTIDSLTTERSYYSSGFPISISFSDIVMEKIKQLVDLHYLQVSIPEKSKQEIIQKIELLDKELNDFTNIKASKLYCIKETELEDILKNYKVKNSDTIDNKFIAFIKQLIQNDLINESYSSYISFTYSNNNDENDMAFIRNVYANIENSFDCKLNNIDAIKDELKNKFYDNKYVFNFDVIKYLAQHNKRNLNRLLAENLNKIKLLYEELDCNDKLFNCIAECACTVDKEIFEYVKNDQDKYRQSCWIKVILCLENQVFKKLVIDKVAIDLIRVYDCVKLIKISNDESDNLTSNLKAQNIKFENIIGLEENLYLFNKIIDNNLYELKYQNIKFLDKDCNYTVLSSNSNTKKYIIDNIEGFVNELVINSIKTIQPQDFYNIIIEKVNVEILCRYFTLCPVKIDNINIINDSKLCIILANNPENTLHILSKNNLKKETLLVILGNLKDDFIQSHANDLLNICLLHSETFNNDLINKGFFNSLMAYLGNTTDKVKLITQVLPIIDENNLMRVLKAYDAQFRKIKNDIILKVNEVNTAIVDKLVSYNIYSSVINLEGNYQLKKTDKPPRLIK